MILLESTIGDPPVVPPERGDEGGCFRLRGA